MPFDNTIKHINHLIANYILLLGFLFFLTGILFFSSISAYHSQIYVFIITPSLFFVLTKTADLSHLWRSRAFQLLLVLLSYALLSLFWNNPELNDIKYIKRILVILLFVLSVFIIVTRRPQQVIQILLIAAIAYCCAAYYSFYQEFIIVNMGEKHRIIGIGNLSNPLLSSHIYGIFSSFLMAYFFARKHSWPQTVGLIFLFVSLLGFIFLTQSRTPLLALGSALFLLLWIHKSKYLLYFVIAIACLAGVYYGFHFDQLIARGLSYRPEIWSIALNSMANQPFLGTGLGTEIAIYISGLDTLFTETHNIHLGLAYNLGLVGLLIWLALLAALIRIYLNNKQTIIAQIGIVLLAYGMTAGMTEGAIFLTRPKEVWFITWLPIALLLAAGCCPNNSDKQGL